MGKATENSRAKLVTKGVLSRTMIDKLEPADKPYEVIDTRLKGLILRVQPSGIKTFYCVFSRGRRIMIGRADAISTEEARIQAKQVLKIAYNGDDPIAERKSKRMSVATFGEYLDQHYEPWVLSSRRSGKATVSRLRSVFSEFLDKPIPELSVLEIDKWKAKRLKLGRKETTVNRDLTALKAALNQAVEWSVINANPTHKVKRIKVDDKSYVRYLSVDEETRLRAAADEREERIRRERESGNKWRRERGYFEMPDLRGVTFVDHIKPMLLLALNTGMRRGEIFGLTWKMVNFASTVLTVEGFVAKSQKTRHIPMNREVVTTLKSWREQSEKTDGLVFPSENGAKFDNISSAWRALLRSRRSRGFAGTIPGTISRHS